MVSMLVALSVAPMLCARRLSPGRPWLLTRRLNAALGGVTAAYGRLLDFALRRLWLSLLATLAALSASVWLFTTIPTAGLPEDETDMLWGWTIAAQDVSLEAMRRLQEEADAIVRGDPAVRHVTSYVGSAGAWANVNNGRFLIALKPPGERRDSARRVAYRLSVAASRVPGLSASFGPVQDVRIRTQSGPSEYDFTLWGGNLALLRAAAPQVAERLRKVPGLRDVWTDQDAAAPQIDLVIDREAANRLRVRISDIGTTLNNAFAQRQIATIYGERNQYRVVLAAKPGQGSGADSSSTDRRAMWSCRPSRGSTGWTETPGGRRSGRSAGSTGEAGHRFFHRLLPVGLPAFPAVEKPPAFAFTAFCRMAVSSKTASDVSRRRLSSSLSRAASSNSRFAAASRMRFSRSATTASKLWPTVAASSRSPATPASTVTRSRS
jgi:hypothetical protein